MYKLGNNESYNNFRNETDTSIIVRLKCPPCRVGSVGSVSASRTVGREFASRPGHTKDHHKNGTNCLPACMR